ncbi:hypothetical protein [Catelliglobosispora koreensis]|uniref:hypothetical protein n=1 Tax=Catelliglobosispora koreensis TaxID=129052 RepID=UPI000368860C|nr:hypothetical protein [Catelliglobosispora koreensis]
MTTERTREERQAIEIYAVALADSAIESVAEDDLNEDGHIADHLHDEACHLAIDIGHGLAMWPAVALDLAQRYREEKAKQQV